MTIKLLTEHHLEFLSLKGGCTGSSVSTIYQNVKLLEIKCHGSIIIEIMNRASCLNPVFELPIITKNRSLNFGGLM